MSSFRFVHLSDIHFGQEKDDGTLIIHDDVRDELVRACEKQRNRLGYANGIIITGDISYSGKKEEFQKAGDWLDQLTESVGCSPTEVKVIPGNHDVDLSHNNSVSDMVYAFLRGADSDKINEKLDGISKGSESANPLLPKFAAYREFAARYGCDFLSPGKPYWFEDFYLNESLKIRILGLNSVQISDKNDKLGEMILGSNQYVVPREYNIEYIVLLHHPLNWFRDRDNAKPYLNRARILLVGHEHLPDINKIERLDGSEHLIISSGATNLPYGENSYSYSYNWLEFKLHSEHRKHKILVTVYPMVWQPLNTSFEPDTTRLKGKESYTFNIDCPNFRLESNSYEEKNGIEEMSDIEKRHEGEISQKEDKSIDFSKLRYFFWKYLDWPQRLRVLVKIDILPPTMNQPLPQTMERLALDSARSSGKLAELWSAIMEFVPEDKQEENPFEKERG